jgi:alpha-galactosidase
MDELQWWVRAKFGGDPRPPPARLGLEVVANHGVVQANGRGEQPMHLGPSAYRRGLYCHAPSRLVVRLPAPGRTFEALAGVDSNDQTSGGRGSVVFSVHVGERTLWQSMLLREGMAGVPVAVALEGVTEFALEVSDGGDGIACDQADWLEARVTLADGSTLWLGEMLLQDRTRPAPDARPPFSFVYGGRPSAELLAAWPCERSSRETEDARHGKRSEHVLAYTDPETGLSARCVAVGYQDFPTVEWTLYLRNGGPVDTPIIADVRPLDIRLQRSPGGEFVLRRIRGDDCTPQSYAPLEEVLHPGTERLIANTGGRPTQLEFPCLNLSAPGQGLLAALGWPGQWSLRLARDGEAGLAVSGGQELTRFVLHPGEEVRTPLVVLQFADGGDWLRAQNLWRRWMLAHNLPWPGGKPLPTLRCLCTGNYYPGLMTVAEPEKAFLQRHFEAGVDFDVWWQDAGWYPCDGVGWPKVGTWEPDPVRFPKGLREVSDLVHAHGKRSMLWVEPERVHPGTWIAENHPEWVHGGKAGGLLRLDEPACRQWLTDHIDRLLAEQGIDFYRQDFNIDPLPFWRAADAPDRQGISEIRHVEGYLAYWDELLRRHPGMLIDSCASGGRRNDLETLRRAVPLLRSDWYGSPEGQQCLTYGLSLWVPYQGTGVVYQRDAYWWRSSMVAELSFGPDARGLAGIDLELVRRMVDEHRRISPYFLGDFWPLAAYDGGLSLWLAWQFDRPDLGQGVVQVFRRAESPYEVARFRLRGLDAAVSYRLTNLVTGEAQEATGEELAGPGLRVSVAERGQTAVIVYERR